MNQILEITNDPLQIKNITLPDGSILKLTLYHIPQQKGWFINELVYGNTTLQGIRISVSYNMLRQFKNRLNFGLSCLTNNNVEPYDISSFSSGIAKLYILSKAEVIQYEDFLNAQV